MFIYAFLLLNHLNQFLTTQQSPDVDNQLQIFSTNKTQSFFTNVPELKVNLQINFDHDYYYMIELQMESSQSSTQSSGYFLLIDEDIHSQQFSTYILSFKLNKTLHFINLDASKILANDLLYLIIKSESVFSFHITVYETAEQSCTSNCQKNGRCEQGECVCLESFIDDDCSISSTIIGQGANQFDIQAYGLSFFNFIILEDSEIQMNLFINHDIVDVSLSANIQSSEKLTAPDFTDSCQVSTIIKGKKNSQYNFIQTKSSMGPIKGQYKQLLIAIKNQAIVPIKGQVQIGYISGSSEDNTMIIIFIVIGALIFVCIVCGSAFFVRKYLSRFDERMQRQQQRIPRPRPVIKKELTLNAENIEQYLPAISYEKISKIYLDDPHCAVCLIEFENSDFVRQTPCKHVFHKDCLQQWLCKNENCPLCRKVLNLENLQNAEKVEKEIVIDEEQKVNNLEQILQIPRDEGQKEIKIQKPQSAPNLFLLEQEFKYQKNIPMFQKRTPINQPKQVHEEQQVLLIQFEDDEGEEHKDHQDLKPSNEQNKSKKLRQSLSADDLGHLFSNNQKNQRI